MLKTYTSKYKKESGKVVCNFVVTLFRSRKISKNVDIFYSMPNFTSITVCNCIFDISGLAFGSVVDGEKEGRRLSFRYQGEGEILRCWENSRKRERKYRVTIKKNSSYHSSSPRNQFSHQIRSRCLILCAMTAVQANGVAY